MTRKKNGKKEPENIQTIVKNYNENTTLKRNDLSNGRWYEDSKGNYYISVTSFDSIVAKGKNFHDWLMKNGYDAIKIRDEKAAIGTIVHAYIDKLVLGEDININAGYELDGVHYNFKGDSDEDK